jgi:hypothetical protein
MRRAGLRRTAALAAAFLILLAAGCGRKAKPEPRSAFLSAAAHYFGTR